MAYFHRRRSAGGSFSEKFEQKAFATWQARVNCVERLSRDPRVTQHLVRRPAVWMMRKSRWVKGRASHESSPSLGASGGCGRLWPRIVAKATPRPPARRCGQPREKRQIDAPGGVKRQAGFRGTHSSAPRASTRQTTVPLFVELWFKLKGRFTRERTSKETWGQRTADWFMYFETFLLYCWCTYVSLKIAPHYEHDWSQSRHQ